MDHQAAVISVARNGGKTELPPAAVAAAAELYWQLHEKCPFGKCSSQVW
jgi:hypothetical protein